MASPPAMPRPIARPARGPSVSVRRMQSMPMGPTGAATARPTPADVRKSDVLNIFAPVWFFLSATLGGVWTLRWHLRFAFCFALASAMRYLASRVAPVRGGTYFSLPPQRKVGKRKRFTPPALDVCPRAPNVPTLHTITHFFTFVANALSVRLTRFIYPRHSTRRQTVHRRPGGKLCVGFRAKIGRAHV